MAECLSSEALRHLYQTVRVSTLKLIFFGSIIKMVYGVYIMLITNSLYLLTIEVAILTS